MYHHYQARPQTRAAVCEPGPGQQTRKVLFRDVRGASKTLLTDVAHHHHGSSLLTMFFVDFSSLTIDQQSPWIIIMSHHASSLLPPPVCVCACACLPMFYDAENNPKANIQALNQEGCKCCGVSGLVICVISSTRGGRRSGHLRNYVFAQRRRLCGFPRRSLRATGVGGIGCYGRKDATCSRRLRRSWTWTTHHRTSHTFTDLRPHAKNSVFLLHILD